MFHTLHKGWIKFGEIMWVRSPFEIKIKILNIAKLVWRVSFRERRRRNVNYTRQCSDSLVFDTRKDPSINSPFFSFLKYKSKYITTNLPARRMEKALFSCVCSAHLSISLCLSVIVASLVVVWVRVLPSPPLPLPYSRPRSPSTDRRSAGIRRGRRTMMRWTQAHLFSSRSSFS